MNTGSEGVLPNGTNALHQVKLREEWEAYYASVRSPSRATVAGDQAGTAHRI